MTAPAVRGCVDLASWRSSRPKGRSASNEDQQGVSGTWADDLFAVGCETAVRGRGVRLLHRTRQRQQTECNLEPRGRSLTEANPYRFWRAPAFCTGVRNRGAGVRG